MRVDMHSEFRKLSKKLLKKPDFYKILAIGKDSKVSCMGVSCMIISDSFIDKLIESSDDKGFDTGKNVSSELFRQFLKEFGFELNPLGEKVLLETGLNLMYPMGLGDYSIKKYKYDFAQVFASNIPENRKEFTSGIIEGIFTVIYKNEKTPEISDDKKGILIKRDIK